MNCFFKFLYFVPEISSNVTRISEISEQTSAAAEQMEVASVEVAKMGEQLNVLVTQFKV